jgi:hypothetical protein
MNITDSSQDSLDGASARRKAATYTEQRKHWKKCTSIPRVRFEPRIPMFDWANTVHALDRTAICSSFLFNFILLGFFSRVSKAAISMILLILSSRLYFLTCCN